MRTIEQEWQLAAEKLAGELGEMHVTLFNLLIELGKTELTPAQRTLTDKAYMELRQSQGRFFAGYADQMGGATPENN